MTRWLKRGNITNCFLPYFSCLLASRCWLTPASVCIQRAIIVIVLYLCLVRYITRGCAVPIILLYSVHVYLLSFHQTICWTSEVETGNVYPTCTWSYQCWKENWHPLWSVCLDNSAFHCIIGTCFTKIWNSSSTFEVSLSKDMQVIRQIDTKTQIQRMQV